MRKKDAPGKPKKNRQPEPSARGTKPGLSSKGQPAAVAIRKKANSHQHSGWLDFALKGRKQKHAVLKLLSSGSIAIGDAFLKTIKTAFQPTRLKKTAGLLGLYAAVACFATWPLIANLKNCMPIGGVRYGTIVLFNLWTLDWNARMLGHEGYWDAPIFYPEKGAFALSEPMPVTGLLYAPFKAVTGNPVTAYDLALLAILTLNGFMAYRLLKQIGAGESGAVLTGVLVVFTPFVFDQLEVIQLTVLFPLFGALAALHACARRPEVRPALRLGLWVFVSFATCTYYGLFLSVFILLGCAMLLERRHLQLVTARNGVLGAALAGLLLLPMVAPQMHYTKKYARGPGEIQSNSAGTADYLRQCKQRTFESSMPGLLGLGCTGMNLYPGTMLLVLAGIGIALARKEKNTRWFGFCLAGCGIAVLLSLGLNVKLGTWQPYEWLRMCYPGFQKLRSPFRFTVFAQIFLVVFAGWALSALAKRRLWLAVLATAIGVLELLSAPINLYRFSIESFGDPWIAYMRQQKGAVMAMVPFPADGAAPSFELNVKDMLYGLEAKAPLVNGYSGFFPDTFHHLSEAMRSFPDTASLRLLNNARVTHVVVDRLWMQGRPGLDLAKFGLPYLTEDRKKIIYGLRR